MPEGSPMTGKSCILAVDDDPRNLALIQAYLGGQHEVLEATGGLEALATLERQAVDLVLLDVMMPGTDGFETCRRIKGTPRAGLLPVLLLTALGDQSARNQGLESGADDFLTKPVDRRELELRVKTFLALRRQEQLIQTQLDQLRELSALKDDLAALLVHDLRSPLTGVMLQCERVAAQLADPVLQGSLVSAQDSLRRINFMLEDLLRIQLMEDHRLQLNLGETHLMVLLAEAAATLQERARQKGVGLAVDPGAELLARMDEALVRRAVENLMGNAVNYSPAGQEVRVALRHEGGVALIQVRDRGGGIPETYRKGLFEKFDSVEARKGTVRRGFGLGLYMVKLVATLHGGSVTMTDREGGGSVFCLALPVGSS